MDLKYRRSIWALIEEQYNSMWRARSKGMATVEEVEFWRDLRDAYLRDWARQHQEEWKEGQL